MKPYYDQSEVDPSHWIATLWSRCPPASGWLPPRLPWLPEKLPQNEGGQKRSPRYWL